MFKLQNQILHVVVSNLLTVPLLALAALPISAATGTMQLMVKDGRTHQPLRASVLGEGLNGFTLNTDADGRAEIELPAGEYRLEISAPGYNSIRTYCAIEDGKVTKAGGLLDSKIIPIEETADTLDAMIRPGFTLFHEYVADADTGRPIPNVKVRFVNAGVESRTDSKGHFYLSVPTPEPENPGGLGTDTLIYEKPGYKTLIIRNFGITDDEMGGIAVDLEKGNGKIDTDGTHPLMREDADAGGTPPQPAEQASGLPTNLYAWQAARGSSVRAAAAVSLATPASTITVPSTIKVGHNCTGKVCTTWDPPMSLETYVSNGLPHEWPTSWANDSIKAGAVAYRSYGAWYVAHPISTNYDICDNTYCQAYDPVQFPPTKRSKADVAATAGVVLSSDGVTILYAEYAAESNLASDTNYATCGDGKIGEPSQGWPCMLDIIDVGKSQTNTHSRGMCQRGSQRWASGVDSTGLKTDTGAVLTTPHDWRCILDHYYNASSNSITVDPSGTGTPGAGSGKRTAFLQGQPTYGLIAYEAYGTKAGSPQGIRVANAADGSNDHSILTGHAFDPSWEPDGGRLAFSNGTGIAVVNADGTGLVQLTSNACGSNPNVTCDYAPVWSPFSSRIAFCSFRSGSPQIWMMNSDGSNPYQVSTNLSLGDSGLQSVGNSGYEQIDCNLSWSPDEKTLAFTGAIGQWDTSNIHNVFTFTLVANTTTQVTYCQNNRPDKSTACQTPAWSPDGSSIAISNDDTLYGDNMGGAGIYTMFDQWNGAFVDYQNLNAHEWFPRYSTDGKKIFFTSNMTDGYWRLYSINPDSTGLTTVIGAGNSPSYQPNYSYSCSICKNFGTL